MFDGTAGSPGSLQIRMHTHTHACVQTEAREAWGHKAAAVRDGHEGPTPEKKKELHWHAPGRITRTKACFIATNCVRGCVYMCVCVLAKALHICIRTWHSKVCTREDLGELLPSSWTHIILSCSSPRQQRLHCFLNISYFLCFKEKLSPLPHEHLHIDTGDQPGENKSFT